eukprot:6433035-Lingulodinium_polyedra.AAC.1
MAAAPARAARASSGRASASLRIWATSGARGAAAGSSLGAFPRSSPRPWRGWRPLTGWPSARRAVVA